MNPFQKNESKETLFSPVSIEEVPPRPPSPPKKPSPTICGSNYPLSIAFIVVNEFCERFSYYGMKAVLILYFLYFLHWNEDTSTSIYHAFSSLCYFTPILGAAIADSWLGKFKTIIYLSLVYVLGHVIKSLGALPILGGQVVHTVLSLIGLSLIALGTGGIKPCVAAFGGDQFEEKHAEERTRYFSVFYLSINAGSLISTFITPMLRGDVQCFGEDCYALAFGVPGLLMVIALVVFAMGSKIYNKPPPEGNIVAQVFKCIWFAISNRFKNRSGDIPKRQHWLDWAAEKYPKQLIMDVKALTRVLFLYIPLPMFWALLDQQGSRWTLQAIRMNRNLGFFVLQPDQMQVLNPLLVLIFIPLFDFVIYRLVSKCGINFSSLRKMAVGMILACLAFAVAAAVEIKINEMAPAQSGPQEVFLQVLNLADDEVKVTVVGNENNSLLIESIKSFQKTPYYSKLHLKTKSQDFHFHLKYHNLSLYTEHSVQEKNWYSLVIREDGNSISSMMVKDTESKTTNGMTTVRFVNTLHKDVNISLNTDTSLNVGEDYGVSAYRTVQRGEYPAVHCRTEDKNFSLNLGLLDFGAAYLFVITNNTNQGLQAWKIEDIPANKMSIAWQLPQYALVTAGEVMFSVTGLEFSYSQTLFSCLTTTYPKSTNQCCSLFPGGSPQFRPFIVARKMLPRKGSQARPQERVPGSQERKNSEDRGSHYVARGGLKLLGSSNHPALASQSSGITDVSHCIRSHFFSSLRNMLLYRCTIVCLYIHPLKNILVASNFW
ncbi:solute carrier family 15 member 2 isoform X1 [Gorilla gorilla gorilla]|uniref:solute carrier family 15 member 2 isoform X1 n=1 Tax=Gorilla gorilla gorilla TaxID=9595 RepID=UPI0024461F74|nr:solute carrier family 15 member 2 isoform X1 [Gorilla gorilla gorilla]